MRSEIRALAKKHGFERVWFLSPALLDGLPRVRSSLYGGLQYDMPPDCKTLTVLAYPYALFPDGSELPEYYLASQRAYMELSPLMAELSELNVRAERVMPPAKGLLIAAGAATRGKNSLVRVSGLGSAVALYTLAIDAELAEAYSDAPPACGACTRCRDACPTGAISDAGLEFCKCLRAHMGAAQHHDAAKALMKTYLGCMECIRACPFNRARADEPAEALAAFDPARLASGDDAEARRLVGKNKTGGGKLVAEAIILHPNLAPSVDATAPPAVADAVSWAKERSHA